jgi:hypothetical protein
MKRKKQFLVSTTFSASAISLMALNQLWYKDYPKSSFHFFNDNKEWNQLDKLGHFYSTYQLGKLGYQSMKWAGFSEKKSLLWGGSFGAGYLAVVELMDGYSEGWGFSSVDFSANLFGSLLFMSQQYKWKEQRIQMKFSFHNTAFPKYRAEILGENFTQQIFKDYNGQTYWASLNLKSMFFSNRKFPPWMNVAFGYGATGMISGSNNYVVVLKDGQQIGLNAYRKYFFSMDVDFSKIKTKSKILKTVFQIVNSVKFPFPTIEFSKKGLQVHPFYF